MVSTSYVRCEYTYFRFLNISLFFHHSEVKNGYFSLLYALVSSPFWPCFLHSIVQRLFMSLLLRDSNISAPFLLFITSLYYPMFSSGLLAIPILELKSPTKTTFPCLLHLYIYRYLSELLLHLFYRTLRLWRHADVS